MDPLAIYNLLIYLVIRIIGFGIAIDFYYNSKEARFKLTVIGWGLWIIASIFSVYSGFFSVQNIIDLLLFLNTLLVRLGTIIYLWVVFSYFVKVPKKTFLCLLLGLTIFLPIITFSTNFDLATNIARFFVNFLLFSLFIVLLIRRKEFKESMGTASKWYLVFLINIGVYIPILLYLTNLDLD